MYTWIELNSAADLVKLEQFISPAYSPKLVGGTLAAGLSDAVKAILIEHAYVDKDYRSTYYHHYAKKGQHYGIDCVRLHFFDSTVQFEDERLRLSCPDGRLRDHYFGFMVLRPTGVATIGRTILSPDIRSGASRFIITADHKAHVLGEKLMISGFPSMDQHVDIAVCAHVACWSILRHYSERYSLYQEFLTHDITLMAQEFDPGGLVPSLGLTVSHAERVFQKANTFPLHISKAINGPDPQFYRQLCSYVESGFPLFAAMDGKAHAIAVVGLDWRSTTNRGAGLRYAWDEVAQLSVVDDNHLPYLSIPVRGQTVVGHYAAEDIDAFIVALPEKVFYPADAVDRLARTLFRLGLLVPGLPDPDTSVVRYFLTTSSALRSFVRKRETEFPTELLRMVMTLPLTQFVWVVEYATQQQWDLGQISARAVIDATASIWEVLPVWLFHSGTTALVIDRKNPSPDLQDRLSTLPLTGVAHAGFSRMDQNLRPTTAK